MLLQDRVGPPEIRPDNMLLYQAIETTQRDIEGSMMSRMGLIAALALLLYITLYTKVQEEKDSGEKETRLNGSRGKNTTGDDVILAGSKRPVREQWRADVVHLITGKVV